MEIKEKEGPRALCSSWSNFIFTLFNPPPKDTPGFPQ